MPVPYTLTDNSVTIVLDLVPFVIPKSHPNWARILENLANDNDIASLIDIPAAIASYMQGAIEIRDRVLYYNDVELDTTLTRRIMQHMEANKPGLAEPLIRFLENVMQNPSYRSVQGLYEWVAKSQLPITGDGQILAWKIVGENYLDLYSGRFDHTPGNIVAQDRNLCDEDPDQTCSAGIHFCSPGYLPYYGTASGNRIVVVKIHPRDVVAFPRDYNTAKGRCCRLEVVGEVERDKIDQFFPNANVYWGFDADIKPGDVPFKAGQVWEQRDGKHVEVREAGCDMCIGACSEQYAVLLGSGEYRYADGRISRDDEYGSDLIRLVSDVA